MASLIYNSLLADLANGAVDFSIDIFKVMLVTSSYTPDKDAHTRRDDVTNEVSGTGYAAGGEDVTVTVGSVDTANDRLDISFDPVVWTGANGFTAAAAVIYKSRGGAAANDELVAFVEFTAPAAANGTDYTLTFTSPLRIQN